MGVNPGVTQRRDLISLVQEFSIPLIVGVFAGLAAANIDPHLYERLVDYRVFGEAATLFGRHLTAHFLINEIFMVFFFGIAAKEDTETVLPGGALNPLQRAINPIPPQTSPWPGWWPGWSSAPAILR